MGPRTVPRHHSSGRPAWLTPVNVVIIITTLVALGLRALLPVHPPGLPGRRHRVRRRAVLRQRRAPGPRLHALPGLHPRAAAGHHPADEPGRAADLLDRHRLGPGHRPDPHRARRHRRGGARRAARAPPRRRWPCSSPAGSWRSTPTPWRPRTPCSWSHGWCCSAWPGRVTVFDGDRLTASTRRLAWGGVLLGFAGAVEAWAIVPVLVIAALCLPQIKRAADIRRRGRGRLPDPGAAVRHRRAQPVLPQPHHRPGRVPRPRGAGGRPAAPPEHDRLPRTRWAGPRACSCWRCSRSWSSWS